MKRITFSNLIKSFPTAKNHEVEVFSKLNLDLPSGKTIALVGKSGVGKSTLLEMLAGLELPTSGEIKITESDKLVAFSDKNRQSLIRLVTMVFQSYNCSLFPWQTVRDTIKFSMSIKGSFCDIRYREIMELCDLVDAKETSFSHELSGGQKQRLALARAISTKPKLLVMDEPCGSVDQLTKEYLNNTFIRIKEAGEVETIFFSTHDITEAVYVADIVLIMSKKNETEIQFERFDIERNDQERFDREAPYIIPYVKDIRRVLA